jgi:hypothetical protein
VKRYCAGCFTHSLRTAAFYEDIKAQIPEFLEMLQHLGSRIRSMGANMLVILAGQRRW